MSVVLYSIDCLVSRFKFIWRSLWIAVPAPGEHMFLLHGKRLVSALAFNLFPLDITSIAKWCF